MRFLACGVGSLVASSDGIGLVCEIDTSIYTTITFFNGLCCIYPRRTEIDKTRSNRANLLSKNFHTHKSVHHLYGIIVVINEFLLLFSLTNNSSFHRLIYTRTVPIRRLHTRTLTHLVVVAKRFSTCACRLPIVESIVRQLLRTCRQDDTA